MADPGFPRGGANLLFDRFSRKLHENEKILTQRGGGARPLAPPFRSTPENMGNSKILTEKLRHQSILIAFHIQFELPEWKVKQLDWLVSKILLEYTHVQKESGVFNELLLLADLRGRGAIFLMKYRFWEKLARWSALPLWEILDPLPEGTILFECFIGSGNLLSVLVEKGHMP